MAEGRVRNTGSSLKPEYIITDQQGNARISFEESTTAGVPAVRQENSYYGMGMAMTSAMVLPTTPNRNLYNGGSEWQNDYSNAPDYYQTLNRNYDAALGRFISVDPAAEATESMTVYQYANNNPIMLNDLDGNYAVPPAGTSQGYWTASTGISAITSLSQVHDLFNQLLYGGAIDDISYNLMKAYFVDGGTGGGDRSFGWVTTSDGGQMRLAWKQFAEANGISSNMPVNLKGNSSSFYLTWDTPAEGEIGVVGHKKKFTLGGVGAQGLIKGVHVIYESETPTIYRNTLKLIRSGFPYLLHYEPSLKKSNRDALLKNYPVESRHIQRDEYPYASTREG